MTQEGASVTWESLDIYISAYSGITKVRRLLHIAEHFDALRIPAYKLALSTLEAESLDTATYEVIMEKLKSCDSSEQLDTTWLRTSSKKATAITDKLEQELKAYKNNLIKESIRMGQQDIANHYVNTGDLTSALRALVRNRDYCTTPLHIFQVNMGIINISILLGNWAQVQSYVAKVENMSAQLKEKSAAQNHINVASALALLSQKKYKDAADLLLQVDASIESTYNNIIAMNDIANYTSLLALATFPRDDILKLSDSASFTPFLELEVASREALTAFHRNRYAKCFRLLDSIKPNMLADIYFAPHVEEIYTLIKERSMLLFIGAFKVISLDRISNVFDMPMEAVRDSLASLIMREKLPTSKIDMRRVLVVNEGKVPRQSVYQKAFDVSNHYAEEVERSLFHLAVVKAGLQVESATIKPPSRSKQFIGASKGNHIIEESEDIDMMEIA
ncbi:putative COP9 signalosome subunit 1 [Taphrina deformans PYCC 5710]|uniref:COP9 signalosome subunit 1 n=1 Tax=Taphrina deformans (strain PYCC 5710 / ATCC 11124 / CBS 356.35 / IMI 108563 / JCM 9778 / NBRC 8474) TaxID=1097556 RepID=R4XC15_TAPDE|nr:putative COP9 signalosome subunit 1 [Taphrina deformans PYCC 5710]|eukprot:CCG83100.1 putative COP9 signalosome subunit 1 [Taphrina deformans PYCC 5710]